MNSNSNKRFFSIILLRRFNGTSWVLKTLITSIRNESSTPLFYILLGFERALLLCLIKCWNINKLPADNRKKMIEWDNRMDCYKNNLWKYWTVQIHAYWKDPYYENSSVKEIEREVPLVGQFYTVFLRFLHKPRPRGISWLL